MDIETVPNIEFVPENLEISLNIYEYIESNPLLVIVLLVLVIILGVYLNNEYEWYDICEDWLTDTIADCNEWVYEKIMSFTYQLFTKDGNIKTVHFSEDVVIPNILDY